jgi:hypothetical protein
MSTVIGTVFDGMHSYRLRRSDDGALRVDVAPAGPDGTPTAGYRNIQRRGDQCEAFARIIFELLLDGPREE